LNYVSVILAVLGKSVIIYGRGKAINELQARHRVLQKYVMLTTTSPPVSAHNSYSISLTEEKNYLHHIYLSVVAGPPNSVYCLNHKLYDQEIMVRFQAEERHISLVHSVKSGCFSSTVLFHGLFSKL
jgi:hypothetical protein